MKKIRIVYFGASNYSLYFLKNLKKQNIDIAGVCSIQINKGFLTDCIDLSNYAKKNQIITKRWTSNNSKQIINWIKKIKPDYIFCIGWPYLLNSQILKLPKFFCVGFHPTKIPENRGRHPIIWSIILKLKKIYPSFFIMTKKPDFGPVISQIEIKIKKNTTSTNLYKFMIKKSFQQSVSLMSRLKRYNRINLNDWLKKNRKNEGNLLRKRNYKDGIVDWRMSSESINNLVNALKYPYPVASFFYKNKEFKLKKVKIVKCKLSLEPGKIISVKNKKPVIKTGDSAIQLLDFKPTINFKERKYIL